MSSNILIKQRIQPWQMAICAGVCGYLALGLATHTVRNYHWFLLLAIPGALLAAERGRSFFLDWAPLIAFWLVYDRLRLIQPLLLDRVAVESAFSLERWLFGWLAGGEAPAHAARAWLAASAGNPVWAGAFWSAQVIYLSHVFLFPALMLLWWVRGLTSGRDRDRFTRHVRAFTALNLTGILIYLILPVAPPWWVSLHGMARPSMELVAQVNMAQAMDGAIVQRLISNAPNWFAAVPSLHGAYCVLLLLMAVGERNRLKIGLLAAYSAAMWAATVVLNQHYIIDLLAGGLLALAAYWYVRRDRSIISGFVRRVGRGRKTADSQA